MRNPMNRSLINLAGIAAIALLAFYLGVAMASKVSSGKGGLSIGQMACLFAVICCLMLLYVAVTDGQIRSNASEEKSWRSAEQAKIASELNRITDAIAVLSSHTSAKTPTDGNPTDIAGLSEAVGVLAKDLASREKESARLLDLIKKKESHKALARIATIRETAEFTRRISDAGKIDDKEALRQLILEVQAAVEDLGMEVLHIAAGTRVSELPSGSFTVLGATEAENAALAGTVKESLSDAIFLCDDAGKKVFISPAKLRVYKL